jgi:hypothetical protein
MSSQKCSRCGAELLPEVNFCRQCGAAANGSMLSSSELPTAVFGPTNDDPSTRRLNARPTSAERGFRGNVASAVSNQVGESSQRRWRPVAFIAVVLALVTVSLIIWVNFGHTRRSRMTTTNVRLVYPGSKTIVDTTTGDGRAIQLQTTDSVDQVVAWYMSNLKPTKTMRLTPTTVVLKNQDVTATVAAEDDKTNILIKSR